MANGNPIPGQFEHKDYFDFSDEKHTVTYMYDAEEWIGEDLYIAAHAVVTESEIVGYEEVEETIFLSNGGTNDKDGLYSVNISNGNAYIDEIYDLDSHENFNFVTHIGASPDGETIYVLGEESGHLGAYSVKGDVFEDLGEIENYPGDVVQVAVSPNGKLYMASTEDNNLYSVNISTLSANLVGSTGVNIQGADIVFDAYGNLYLHTNSNNGLYMINPNTGAASILGITEGVITGLAIRDGGTGALLGSDTNSNEIISINKKNGTIINKYSMMANGEPFDHKWGDMTVGTLSDPIYSPIGSKTAWAGQLDNEGEDPEDNNEYGIDLHGRNWATYIKIRIELDN